MRTAKTYIIAVFILSISFAQLAEAVTILPPAIDLSGNWTYTHWTGKKNSPTYVRELSFTDLTVETAVIIPFVEWYLNDTPGTEEIIDATVSISTLVRDSADNWLFSDGTFAIEENGNTFITGSLVNVRFEPDANNPYICWLNADLDLDNLVGLDASMNTRPSRFIEVLNGQMVRYGADYTNLRFEMDLTDGVVDFTDNSYGTSLGKIEGIPEPASAALLLSGGITAIIGVLRRKKRRGF